MFSVPGLQRASWLPPTGAALCSSHCEWVAQARLKDLRLGRGMNADHRWFPGDQPRPAGAEPSHEFSPDGRFLTAEGEAGLVRPVGGQGRVSSGGVGRRGETRYGSGETREDVAGDVGDQVRETKGWLDQIGHAGFLGSCLASVLLGLCFFRKMFARTPAWRARGAPMSERAR
jgi:hypothetical protein